MAAPACDRIPISGAASTHSRLVLDFPDSVPSPLDMGPHSSKRTQNDAKLRWAGTAEKSMPGFRAIVLFLLGVVLVVSAGFGALHVAEALLTVPGDPWRRRPSLDSIHPFPGAALLVATGLICAIAVAKVPRTQRLRTVMAGIALLALLLGGAIAVRRRAERFRGMQLQYYEPALRLDDPRLREPTTPETMRATRLRHWRHRMSERYGRAAHRPWLPVPPL